MPVSFAVVALGVVVAVVISILAPVWYGCSNRCMCFLTSAKNIQSTCSWCMHKCHFLSPRCLRHQFHCCHPSVFVPPISLLLPFSVCLCQCHLLVCAAHFIFCQPWHCTACSFLASCNVCTVKFHFLPWPVLRPQFHFLYPIVFAPVFVGQYFQCHFLPPIWHFWNLIEQTSPTNRFVPVYLLLSHLGIVVAVVEVVIF